MESTRVIRTAEKGESIEVHRDFLLVISYNPGYQSVLKDLIAAGQITAGEAFVVH